MKKCPMCGKDVSDEIKYCHNCGYDFKGKNRGVFYQPNSDIRGNFFKNQISLGGKIFIFIIFFFFLGFPLIIFMLFFFVASISNNINIEDEYEYDNNYDYSYNYTCNDLCVLDYVSFDDKCICENGDIYYKDNGELYYESTGSSLGDSYKRCEVFCRGNLKDYTVQECTCMNGQKVDKYGEFFYDISADTEKVISNWENDILSGKTITTVFCDLSFKYNECSQYKKVVETVKMNNDISIYYINLSDLNSVQRQKVLFTFNIDFYYNYPYTFIMKDGKLLNAMSGMMYEQALEKFLSDNGVI